MNCYTVSDGTIGVGIAPEGRCGVILSPGPWGSSTGGLVPFCLTNPVNLISIADSGNVMRTVTILGAESGIVNNDYLKEADNLNLHEPFFVLAKAKKGFEPDRREKDRILVLLRGCREKNDAKILVEEPTFEIGYGRSSLLNVLDCITGEDKGSEPTIYHGHNDGSYVTDRLLVMQEGSRLTCRFGPSYSIRYGGHHPETPYDDLQEHLIQCDERSVGKRKYLNLTCVQK